MLRRSRAGGQTKGFAHDHGMGKAFPVPVETQTDSPPDRNQYVTFVGSQGFHFRLDMGSGPLPNDCSRKTY